MTHHTPWWKGATIYQIYPRSFLDTDGDGVGDLKGIMARLDHVAALGVDAIWISPFFASPMKDFGYDVSDYRRVDPLFGTNDDFRQLLDAAHGRGLKVLVDMVLAHTSDRHAWFQESRRSRGNAKADWYVWADPQADGTPPNNWLSFFGGPAWHWEASRSQYYLHHFLKEQPNLNWHNPAVEAAMLDEVAFWLDLGVDGLRLDAISSVISDIHLRSNPPVDPQHGAGNDDLLWINSPDNNPMRFQQHIHDQNQPEVLGILEALRRLSDRYDGERFLLGEIIDQDGGRVAAAYTRGRHRLHSAYTFQLTQDRMDAGYMRQVIRQVEKEIAEGGWLTWTMSNHDRARIISRFAALPHLSGDWRALARQMMALTLTMRGSVCLYQGDELGLDEAEIPHDRLRDPWGIVFWPDFKGRDGCRTPMPWRGDQPHCGFSTAEPWLPFGANHADRAVDRQEGDPASVLNAYRRFIAWRRRQPALRTGDLTLEPAQAESVLAFQRSGADQRLLCVFNIANEAAEITLEDRWRPVAGHGFEGAALGADGRLHLPAFGVFIGEAG
ncbi:MAG: alpha-glucosidase family protein [Azospirillaceae bacterium]